MVRKSLINKEEERQENIAKEAIAIMKKGFHSGGYKIKSRDKLHER